MEKQVCSSMRTWSRSAIWLRSYCWIHHGQNLDCCKMTTCSACRSTMWPARLQECSSQSSPLIQIWDPRHQRTSRSLDFGTDNWHSRGRGSCLLWMNIDCKADIMSCHEFWTGQRHCCHMILYNEAESFEAEWAAVLIWMGRLTIAQISVVCPCDWLGVVLNVEPCTLREDSLIDVMMHCTLLFGSKAIVIISNVILQQSVKSFEM